MLNNQYRLYKINYLNMLSVLQTFIDAKNIVGLSTLLTTAAILRVTYSSQGNESQFIISVEGDDYIIKPMSYRQPGFTDLDYDRGKIAYTVDEALHIFLQAIELQDKVERVNHECVYRYMHALQDMQDMKHRCYNSEFEKYTIDEPNDECPTQFTVRFPSTDDASPLTSLLICIDVNRSEYKNVDDKSYDPDLVRIAVIGSKGVEESYLKEYGLLDYPYYVVNSIEEFLDYVNMLADADWAELKKNYVCPR